MAAHHFLIHLAIPHASNNHKAQLLKTNFLFLLSLLLLISQVFLTNLPKVFPVILGYASNISADAVIRLANEERSRAGLPGLVVNPLLTSAASAKAADMLARDYWAHVAPDGTEPWKFFKDSGYNYRYAGENLARDFSNPQDVVAAWMASPSHRDNLLSSRYQEIGIAVVEGGLGGVDTTLVVQFFGSRGLTSVASEPGESRVVGVAEASSQKTPLAKINTQNQPTTSVSQTIEKPGSSGKIVVSPFWTSQKIFSAFVLGLIALLAVDIFVVWQKKIVRIAGRSLAHFSFLVAVLVVVLFLRTGVIL